MKRDVALRVDGMLIAVRGALNGVAAYAHRNLSKAESQFVLRQIGASMAETIEISNALYRAHPDIVPEELIPGSKVARKLDRATPPVRKRRTKRKTA